MNWKKNEDTHAHAHTRTLDKYDKKFTNRSVLVLIK